MDYILAKNLKDAGFPQRYTKEFEYMEENKDNVFIPELTDIIHALGDKFYALKFIGGKIGWRAESPATGSQSSQTIQWIERDAPTAEEAVANLYLALHEK